MFGVFKPSAPLSGGLLWKIPWRLSPSQKLRQRRRLRRVDNIVSVLDSALQRQARAATLISTSPSSTSPEAQDPSSEATGTTASASELETTAQGQRLLSSQSRAQRDFSQLRQGRGPKRGDIITLQHSPSMSPDASTTSILSSSPTMSPGFDAPGGAGIGIVTTLSEQARRNGTMKQIERWKESMPSEAEMLPRDKYTMFDRKAKGYRKGVHKLPKWTRVSQRINPPGY